MAHGIYNAATLFWQHLPNRTAVAAMPKLSLPMLKLHLFSTYLVGSTKYPTVFTSCLIIILKCYSEITQ